MSPFESTTTRATATKRVAVLDGLRGLAVAWVLIHHLHEYVPRLWPGQVAFGISGPMAHAMSYLWVGVDLFYVLSGFFIGSAALRMREWQPITFIKSRLTRILPAYYMSMFLALLLLNRDLLSGVHGWINIAMHMLMLHTMQEWTLFAINGPYWTLGVEFGFYMFMLALAPVWRTRWGWGMLPLMLAVSFTWKAAALIGHPAPAQRFFWSAQLPGALDEFAMGMVVALVRERGWLARLAPRASAWGTTLALIGTMIFLACMRHLMLLQMDYWMHWNTVLFLRSVLGLGFALLIAAFLLLAHGRVLPLLVRWSGLGWLGAVSYSAYLYHVPVILLMHRAVGDRGFPGWTWIAVTVLITFAISYASYRWVEQRWHPNL